MAVKSEQTYGRGIKLTPISASRKLISIGMAFVFTVTSVTWTTPAVAAPADVAAPVVFPIDTFAIPAEMGTITETYRGERGTLNGEREGESVSRFPLAVSRNDRTVILIQDAHAVIDAQENIAKILGHLRKNYDVRLTALEGAKGRLEPVLLRTFPEPSVRRKVLAGYEKRAELSGPEMAAVLEEKAGDYRGMEDWGLYEKNYFAYLRAQEKKPLLLAQWNAFKQTLDSERAKIYDPKLNEFEDIRENFLAERASLLDLLIYLSKFKDLLKTTSGYQELPKLLESIGYERSGKPGALQPLVRKIADEFKAKYLRGLGVKTEMNFYNRYQAFMTGQITPGQMLQYLVQLGSESGKAVRLPPALKKLLGHSEVLSEIKGSRLGDELQGFLSQVESSLIKTPAERELAEKYRKLFLLKEMISLALTHEDLARYQKEPDAYLGLIADPAFKQNLAPALEFYRVALERDHAFFKNIMSMMEKETPRAPNSRLRTVTVVAGGFHTQGLERLLKEKGVTYAVVAPKIASLAGNENYAKVMKGDVSFKESLKSTYFDALMRHAAKTLVESLPIQDRVKTLKVWRDNVIREFAAEGRIAEVGKYLPYIDEILQGMPDVVNAVSPKRSKEEILDGIRKELEKFKKDSMERIWKTFGFQLDVFTDGLKQLIARKDLSVQSVADLLDHAGRSKPSFVALIQSLDPTIRVMTPSALSGMESPEVMETQPPALPAVAPNVPAAEVSSPTQRSGVSFNPRTERSSFAAPVRAEVRMGAKVRALIMAGMFVALTSFVSIDAAYSPAMAAGAKFETMASLPKDVRTFLLKGFDRGAILEKAERREAELERDGKEATRKRVSEDLTRIIDTVYVELPENERKAMHNLAMYIMQIESGFENMVQRSGKKLEPVLVGIGLGQVELATVKETFSHYFKLNLPSTHSHYKIYEAEKAFVDECLRRSVNITLAQLIKSFQTADPEILRLALARPMLDNEFAIIMVLIKMDRLRLDFEAGTRVAAGGEKSFSEFDDAKYNFYKLYRGGRHETPESRLLRAELNVEKHQKSVDSESGVGTEKESTTEVSSPPMKKEVPAKEVVAGKTPPSEVAAEPALVEKPVSSTKAGYSAILWILAVPLMGFAIAALIERYKLKRGGVAARRGYRDISHQRAAKVPAIKKVPIREVATTLKVEKPVSYAQAGRTVLFWVGGAVRFLGGGMVTLGHRLYLAIRYSKNSPRSPKNQMPVRRINRKDHGRRSEVRTGSETAAAANRSEIRKETGSSVASETGKDPWGSQKEGLKEFQEMLETLPVSDLGKVLLNMGDVDKMGAMNVVFDKHLVGVLGNPKSLDLKYSRPNVPSPFVEFRNALQVILKEHHAEIFRGAGGDEFMIVGGEGFDAEKLKSAVVELTTAFRDRYSVVRVKRTLDAEEQGFLEKKNYVSVIVNHGTGTNILVDKRILQKDGGMKEFLDDLLWRLNVPKDQLGEYVFETAARGFFSISIGGVSASNAIDYLSNMMDETEGEGKGRAFWTETRNVVDKDGQIRKEEFLREDHLDLFTVWGMRLANDALLSAKETGRNRVVIMPEGPRYVKKPMTAAKILEEMAQIKRKKDNPQEEIKEGQDRITGFLEESSGRAIVASGKDEFVVVEEFTALNYGEDERGENKGGRGFHRFQELIGYDGGDAIIKSLGKLVHKVFRIKEGESNRETMRKGTTIFREPPDKFWGALTAGAQKNRGPPTTIDELDEFAVELGKTAKSLGVSKANPPMLVITRIYKKDLDVLKEKNKESQNEKYPQFETLLTTQDIMSLVEWEWFVSAIKSVSVTKKKDLEAIVDVEWGEHSSILTFNPDKAGALLDLYRKSQDKAAKAALENELGGRFVSYPELYGGAARSEVRLRTELQDSMDQILKSAETLVFSGSGAKRNVAFRRFVEELARDHGIELIEGSLGWVDYNRDQFRNYFLAPGAILREIREKQYGSLIQTLLYVALLPIMHLMGQFMPPFTLAPKFDRAGEMKKIFFSTQGKVYLSAIPAFTLSFGSLGILSGSAMLPLLELIEASVFFYAIEWILTLFRSGGHELSHVLQSVLIAAANHGTGKLVTDAEADAYYSHGRAQQLVDGQGIGNAAPSYEQFEKIVRDVFQAMEEMLQKKGLSGTRFETPAARSEVRDAGKIVNDRGESFDVVYERTNMDAGGELQDPRNWRTNEQAAYAESLSKMSRAELGNELHRLFSYPIDEIGPMVPINDLDLLKLTGNQFLQGFVDHLSGELSHYIGYAKPRGQVLNTLRSLDSWAEIETELNNFALAMREVAIRWSGKVPVIAEHPLLGKVVDVKQRGLSSDQLGQLAKELYELSTLCYSQKEQKGMSVEEWLDILKDPHQSVYILRNLSGAIVGAAVGGSPFNLEGKKGVWLDRLMSLDDGIRGKGTFLLDSFLSQMFRNDVKKFKWDLNRFSEGFYVDEPNAYLKQRQESGMLKALEHDYSRSVTPEADIKIELLADPLDPKFDPLRLFLGTQRSEARFEISKNIPVIAEHPLLGKVVDASNYLEAYPDQLKTLAETLYDLELLRYSGEWREEDLRKWEEMLKDPRQYIQVLISPSGDLVGATRSHLRPLEEGKGERLYRIMSIEDGMRGRGTLLMDAFMDAMYARGLTAIDLYFLYGSEDFWARYFKPRQEKGMVTFEKDDHLYNVRLLESPLNPKFDDLRDSRPETRGDADQKEIWRNAFLKEIKEPVIKKEYEVTPSARRLVESGSLPQGAKILDIGSWMGHDALYFAKHGFDVTATDFIEEPLDHLLGIAQGEGIQGRVHTRLLDLQEPVKLPAETYDVIFAHLSMHYLEDVVLKQRLDELWRSLKTGGRIILVGRSVADGKFVSAKQREGVFVVQGDGKRQRFFEEQSMKDYLADAFQDISFREIPPYERYVNQGLSHMLEVTITKRDTDGADQASRSEMRFEIPANVPVITEHPLLGKVVDASNYLEAYPDQLKPLAEELYDLERASFSSDVKRRQTDSHFWEKVLKDPEEYVYLLVSPLGDLVGATLGNLRPLEGNSIWLDRLLGLKDEIRGRGTLLLDSFLDQMYGGNETEFEWFGTLDSEIFYRRFLTDRQEKGILAFTEDELSYKMSLLKSPLVSEFDALRKFVGTRRSEVRLKAPEDMPFLNEYPIIGKVVDAREWLKRAPDQLEPLAEELYNLELSSFPLGKSDFEVYLWEKILEDSLKKVYLLKNSSNNIVGAFVSSSYSENDYQVAYLEQIMSLEDGILGKGQFLMDVFFGKGSDDGMKRFRLESMNGKKMKFYDSYFPSRRERGILTFSVSPDGVYKGNIVKSPLAPEFDDFRKEWGAQRSGIRFEIPAKAVINNDYPEVGIVVDVKKLGLSQNQLEVFAENYFKIEAKAFPGEEVDRNAWDVGLKDPDRSVFALINASGEPAAGVYVRWVKRSNFAVLETFMSLDDGIRGKGTLFLDVVLREIRQRGITDVRWSFNGDSKAFYDDKDKGYLSLRQKARVLTFEIIDGIFRIRLLQDPLDKKFNDLRSFVRNQRSEARVDQNPLVMVAEGHTPEIAQMAQKSNPDAVRAWFLKQGRAELGKKIDAGIAQFQEELAQYNTAQEIIPFIQSPGFQDRLTALLGEFGDVAELVSRIRNRVVFSDEPQNSERLADNASQLDVGKIASDQALLDAAAAGLLMNPKEPSFVLLMDRPGDGIAEEVLAMLATLKPSQLIVYNAAKEKPFGRAWQSKLKIPIMPIGNEGAVRRAVKASSDLVVSFWTKDRGMDNLGIYSVLAEIGRIADPRLRELALTAVRVAILRFATLDKETQDKVLAKPSTIQSYLEQFGIPAFIQFNAKGLVFNIERLVEAYTARQAVEKAA